MTYIEIFKKTVWFFLQESFIVKNTDMDIKSLSQPNRVERVCVVSQGKVTQQGFSSFFSSFLSFRVILPSWSMS